MGVCIYDHGSNKIRVQVRQSGVKKTRVFLKSEKKEAQRWGYETWVLIRQNKVTSFVDRLTLKQVLQEYLEEDAPNLKGKGLKNKQSIVRQLNKESFVSKRIDLVTSGDLLKYKNRMANNYNLASSTARKQLCTISVAIKYYIKSHGSNIDNPMDGVKLPPAHESPREYKLFEVGLVLRRIRERSHDSYVAAAIAAYTGMRKGEIVNLHWDEVDFLEKNCITVRSATNKNKGSRTITLNKTILDILRTHYYHCQKNRKTKANPVIRVSGDNFVRHFKRAVKELSLDRDYKFHDLRHTYLSRLADTGIDIFTLQAISGHKDIETLRKYVHRKDEKHIFTDAVDYRL